MALERRASKTHFREMDETDNADGGLAGKLLIAMPGMGDPRFERTVIYICAHSDDGALGIVINRRAESVEPKDLFSQLDIDLSPHSRQRPIHYGGPVETGRGFVLHSSDYRIDDATLEVDDDVSMTASVEILRDIAAGEGPRQAMIALGYAGWGSGQLEDELQRNGWLTCDSDAELVFSRDDDGKWAAALARLGITPLSLSAEGGRA